MTNQTTTLSTTPAFISFTSLANAELPTAKPEAPKASTPARKRHGKILTLVSLISSTGMVVR